MLFLVLLYEGISNALVWHVTEQELMESHNRFFTAFSHESFEELECFL